MTREELNQDKQQEIIDEERRDNIKKYTIMTIKFLFIIFVVFSAFYFYANYISSKVLFVNEKRLYYDNLPNNFEGLKVIQFSDLHYGTTFFDEDLEKVVKEINQRKPDIVFFTGDLIDSKYNATNEEKENIIKILKKINVSLGKYAISGEDDTKYDYASIMKQGDFIVLDNSYDFIYNNVNSPILVTGTSINANISNSFQYFSLENHNKNIFTISLVHEPDLVDEIISKYPTNIFLAGHSHNGNIRIPFIGPIKKIDGSKKYYDSYYKVNNSDLFISSGLGTDENGFRMFCHPSINFFRISRK